jgi:hypothetical protein
VVLTERAPTVVQDPQDGELLIVDDRVAAWPSA